MNHPDALEALRQKLKANYDRYILENIYKGMGFLIANAPEIGAMQLVYNVMSKHDFSDSELAYLSQFQIPLEVVGDYYYAQNNELFSDELSDMMEDIMAQRYGIEDYDVTGTETSGVQDTCIRMI